MTERDDKGEYDVDEDENVAGSRAGKDGEDDGTYVGRTSSDDALDVGETGAEARSEDGGTRRPRCADWASGRETVSTPCDAHDYMTYEEFGRKFFEVAVTEERVGGAIADIAGDAFEMGPMGQGPGKIAKVTAKVNIQDPRVTRHVGDTITFAIRIPLEIDMVIDLRIDRPRFMVFGEISLARDGARRRTAAADPRCRQTAALGHLPST